MFAIIYSKNTGRVRWYTDTGHTSEELDGIVKVGLGEILLKADDQNFGNSDDIQNYLTGITNITPSNDRYAVVDANGKIVATVLADPLCGDQVANCRLVAHATAQIGWTYDDKLGFIPPIETPAPIKNIL